MTKASSDKIGIKRAVQRCQVNKGNYPRAIGIGGAMGNFFTDIYCVDFEYLLPGYKLWNRL
jgi:hypothetical protein